MIANQQTRRADRRSLLPRARRKRPRGCRRDRADLARQAAVRYFERHVLSSVAGLTVFQFVTQTDPTGIYVTGRIELHEN
jgi:hypothetical protein